MRTFLTLCLAFCLALMAAPAAALEICDELWFTRNLIYDRAGYCFSSPLGQAIFDNADCTGTDINLDRETLNMAARLQAAEMEWDCNVDSSRRSLDVFEIAARMRMIDIPEPDGYESGCIGWLGEPLRLHAARHEAAPVTGLIRTGESIYYGFTSVGEWHFIISSHGTADMGWLRDRPDLRTNCRSFAG